MEVEAQLGGEVCGSGAEFVVVTALFEGDQELVGNGTAEDWPGHRPVTVGGTGDWGGNGGLGEGAAEYPAAEDIPGEDFGGAIELNELVFGSLGEFDAIAKRVPGT